VFQRLQASHKVNAPKTSLARAAAGASGVSFLSLTPADVYSSSFVGDAEAVVRRAFTLARSAAPCVLFFDEVDAIIGSSSGNGAHGMERGHTAEARVLSTMLNEMDGIDGSWKDGVLILGATNRPWTIDKALLRPGRFDKVIFVPPPDIEGRRSILEMQTNRWPMSTMLDLDYLSSEEVTGTMTGAELIGACRTAAMLAVRNASEARNTDLSRFISQESLVSCLRDVKPLLSRESVIAQFHRFESDGFI
jgi:SpoVK/Ycf46/Vps4 family AAA+-type ATPase